jgi:hypothetical protein
MQVRAALQSPERQTVAPLAALQGPSPFANPQELSVVSQTPLTQTSVAAVVAQVPSSVGLACGESVGIAPPLASFGVHVCEVSLHHLPPAQSASRLQLPAIRHFPLALQAPDRQIVAPFATVHGPSLLA